MATEKLIHRSGYGLAGFCITAGILPITTGTAAALQVMRNEQQGGVFA
ncbi:MAG: hypothetical protein U5P41_03265 [Gammaproteobacteria bacterium]|nr:hypothetical protein [Gammaproteobacteria bacterium]